MQPVLEVESKSSFDEVHQDDHQNSMIYGSNKGSDPMHVRKEDTTVRTECKFAKFLQSCLLHIVLAEFV